VVERQTCAELRATLAAEREEMEAMTELAAEGELCGEKRRLEASERAEQREHALRSELLASEQAAGGGWWLGFLLCIACGLVGMVWQRRCCLAGCDSPTKYMVRAPAAAIEHGTSSVRGASQLRGARRQPARRKW
jgi:hypothetical protein